MVARQRKDPITALLDDYTPLERLPALSENDFVNFAIEFANSASLRSWHALTSGSRPPAKLYSTPESEREVEAESQSFRELGQFEFRSQLGGALYLLRQAERGRRLPANSQVNQQMQQLKDRISAKARRMVLIPAPVEWKGDVPHVLHRYVPESSEAAFAYVILLVLDRSRPFARDVCQCRWCDTFFRSSQRMQEMGQETGKRPRRYCSPKHMHEAHDAEAAKRAAESRKNRRSRRQK